MAAQAMIRHWTAPDVDPDLRRTHDDAIARMQGPIAAGISDMVWADLAMCRCAMGDVDTAESYVESGLAAGGMVRNLMRPQLLVTQALIALARGDQETAERAVEEANRFVEEREMQYLRPMVAWAYAQVLVAAGDRERALARLGYAETIASDLQLRPWLGNILLLEAALLADLGRTDESAAKAARHRELTGEIAALIVDPELRASYPAVSGL